MSRAFPPGCELRRADVDRMDDILTVLDSAALWLRSKGVVQWPDRFEADDVLTSLVQGDTWLALVDGVAAGTITVNWADPLWDSTNDDGGYVHRLAVLRSSQGLGRQLLEWAAEETSQRGRRFVRLDCVATNGDLRAYYESAGFHHRGDVLVAYPASSRELSVESRAHSLYQRAVDGSCPPHITRREGLAAQARSRVNRLPRR